MKTLPEILDYGLWNEGLNAASDYGTRKYGKRKEAALTTAIEATAKELMGCLPEKLSIPNKPDSWDFHKGHFNSQEQIIEASWKNGYNQALDEVRARLTAFIGKEK